MRAKKVRHGMRDRPEYAIWKAAKTRCFNPKIKQAKDYSERGITMCPEWAQSFPAFLEAVGPRPHPKAMLDREDNEKGYIPGNVRWVDRRTSNINRRNRRMLEFQGETLPLSVVAEKMGITPGALKMRLRRAAL